MQTTTMTEPGLNPAANSPPPTTIAIADPQAVRELIADTAWGVGVYSGILQDAAAVGDDALVRYATKAIIAGVRAARDAARMLPLPVDAAGDHVPATLGRLQ